MSQRDSSSSSSSDSEGSRLPLLSASEVLERMSRQVPPIRQTYAAMYSSWFGGIVREPSLMVIPIDDHGFHRGDAVFEAIKCVDGRIYALDRHLERMKRSADAIHLKLPRSLEEMHRIAVETVRASGLRNCYLRYYASRGPGGFTQNPYDSIGAQIYLVITAFKAMPAEKYETGVAIMLSSIRVKEGIFATVKSCNYLPNVLMKKEAVDAGVDFSVSRDEHGWIAEGSTENFAIISKDGELVVPGFERTLKGVTASRLMELAERDLVPRGLLKGVRNGHLTEEDVLSAREAMMLGTTLDVLPVTTFGGRKIGEAGRVGPLCRELQKSLLADMVEGPLVTAID